MRRIGKRGGKARAESLTPEQRSEIARKAGSMKGKKNAEVDAQAGSGESPGASVAEGGGSSSYQRQPEG